MENKVALALLMAIKSAPYQIEKDRYSQAAQEISRLQQLVDAPKTLDVADDSLITYDGAIWHADESDHCVRIFRGHMQIIKAPKRDTPYEEYWPTSDQLTWMLQVLNQAEMTRS